MPTKKRSLGAGPGEFSVIFLRRLEELRLRMNHGEFADFLGEPRPRYNGWRNDRATPGADAIRQIAERCDVSADWLLGRPGAAKSPTQAWDSATLEAELSAELCRRLSIRAHGSTIIADGKQLLDRLTEDEWAAMEAWDDWKQHLAQYNALLKAAADHVTHPPLAEWLRSHAARLPNDLPVAPRTRPPIAEFALGGKIVVHPAPPSSQGTKKTQRAKSPRKRKRRNAG